MFCPYQMLCLHVFFIMSNRIKYLVEKVLQYLSEFMFDALICSCRFLHLCNLEDILWCEIQLICFEVLGSIQNQSSLGSSYSRYISKLLSFPLKLFAWWLDVHFSAAYLQSIFCANDWIIFISFKITCVVYIQLTVYTKCLKIQNC